MIQNGRTVTLGGTSASAPAFAALVSLLNEDRLQKGHPPLGFLNPWMYQNIGAFSDVVVGDNAVDKMGFRLKYGFNCTTGWVT